MKIKVKSFKDGIKNNESSVKINGRENAKALYFTFVLSAKFRLGTVSSPSGLSW
jgi:hypothetical protein